METVSEPLPETMPLPVAIACFAPGFFEEELFVVGREVFNTMWAQFGAPGTVTLSEAEQLTLVTVYGPTRLAWAVLLKGSTDRLRSCLSDKEDTASLDRSSRYLSLADQMLTCGEWV